MWLVGGPLVVFLLAFGLFILIEGPGVWAVPFLPFVGKVYSGCETFIVV